MFIHVLLVNCNYNDFYILIEKFHINSSYFMILKLCLISIHVKTWNFMKKHVCTIINPSINLKYHEITWSINSFKTMNLSNEIMWKNMKFHEFSSYFIKHEFLKSGVIVWGCCRWIVVVFEMWISVKTFWIFWSTKTPISFAYRKPTG